MVKTKDLAGLLHRLERPTGPVDVVLDTDTYNEVDDQFALSYLLASQDQLRVKALYAAPFFNENSTGPADGMEKSYQEILKLLGLAGCQELRDVVFRGSASYLPDEGTPVPSPAAEDLARRAMGYSPEAPLYVVAIGALTNIASALLLEPAIAQRITLVWLGGNAWDWPDNQEFNAFQDVAADRVVFGSGAAVVQLPCQGWCPPSGSAGRSCASTSRAKAPCATTWWSWWRNPSATGTRAPAGRGPSGTSPPWAGCWGSALCWIGWSPAPSSSTTTTTALTRAATPCGTCTTSSGTSSSWICSKSCPSWGSNSKPSGTRLEGFLLGYIPRFGAH